MNDEITMTRDQLRTVVYMASIIGQNHENGESFEERFWSAAEILKRPDPNTETVMRADAMIDYVVSIKPVPGAGKGKRR